MTATPEQLRILETLVDELLKDEPAEEVVRDCMTAVGLPDSRDHVDRINKVLQALHFEERAKGLEE